MALTKVTETTLFSITSTASNTNTIGSSVDVSTYYGGDTRIRLGRGTGTAFTAAPTIRVQAVYKTSPNANDWKTLCNFSPQLGTNIASQAVSGTVNAGATTFGVAAATNFGTQDYLFLHNTTLGNSEWTHLISISGTTITQEAALVNAQTGSTCRDQAEEYPLGYVDMTAFQKMRCQVDGSNSGQAVIVEAGFGAVSAL